MRFRPPASLSFPVFVSVAFSAFLWGLFFHFPQGGSPLLLRFHVGSGAELFGSRGALSALPESAGVVLVSNMFFLLALRRRDKALALLFAWATVFLEGFFLFALAMLFLVNRT